MKRLLSSVFLSLTIVSCSNTMKAYETLEEARDYISEFDVSQPRFELAVSDTLQDPMGMNMAILLDGILAKGFEPDGFEQKDGYRVYQYKKKAD